MKRKKKIAILHYLPLEFYPPICNLLNYISTNTRIKVEVFSTHNNRNRKPFTNNGVANIFRVAAPQTTDNSVLRLFKYLWFNVSVFLKLCWLRPDRILYYESYSVGPVYWYLKFVSKKAKLYIHYHEYDSPSWFLNAMKLVKWYHELEQKFLYNRASRITQTNKDRISLFLKDNKMVSKNQMEELPNYPSKVWLRTNEKTAVNAADFIKTVYVGSLSLKDTFIREYCEWIEKQQGKVIFHIYAYNLHQDTSDYLNQLDSDWIKFYNKGIEYDEIPKVISKYDVGVILYKAETDNFKYNAPNKLFEYMACGLEVWYSDKMLGINPFKKDSYPRIISVDFSDIATEKLINKSKLDLEPHTPFFCEEIYKPFIQNLIS
jgi:hypothetical protein